MTHTLSSVSRVLRFVLVALWAIEGGGPVARAQPADPQEERDADDQTVMEDGKLQAPDPSEPPQPVAERGPTPLSLTVSGGVSLGSYEAGFLYYPTEWLKRNPERAELRIATGASAGSTNALYALLSSCADVIEDPRRSLFWTWVQLGLEDIFRPQGSTPVSVFSAEGAKPAFDAIEVHWRRGLRATCDVLYGATVTRLRASEVRSADGNLRLPRLEDRFTMRIRGNGVGKAPSIADYAPAPRGAYHVQLLFPPDREVETLTRLLTASSAFPIAFPPVELQHCPAPVGTTEPCTMERAHGDLFIDGGVFDNTPVSLAVRLVERGLRRGPGGEYWIRDAPSRAEPHLPEEARFVVVAPDLASEARRAQEKQPPPESVLPMALQFFGTFIATARSRELTKLLDSVASLNDQILVAPESLPPMSGHMQAFFGFFEQRIRRFDFVLGMHEGRRFLETHLETDLARTEAPVHWVEPPREQALEHPVYRAYTCLQQALDPERPAPRACDAPYLRDFRILLQVSMEVLHQRCDHDGVRGGGLDCAQVRDGDAPRGVMAGAPLLGFERGEREGETRYVLRRLAQYRFHFGDLGLSRDEAERSAEAIRDRLEELIAALARQQRTESVGESITVRTLGRMGANSVSYQPPRYTLHLSLGTPWEVGGTGLLPARHYQGLRWMGGLQFWGLTNLLDYRSRTVGLAPVAGLELEAVRLGGPFLQLRFGAVGGYIFFRQGGLGRTECDPEIVLEEGQVCSRPVTQTYVSLTLLELIRLGFNVVVLPRLRSRGDPRLYTIRPSVGVQLSF